MYSEILAEVLNRQWIANKCTNYTYSIFHFNDKSLT